MTSPLLFCLSILALLATPGPTNMLITISGASAGLRRWLVLVPVELTGYVIAILVIGLVIGPILTGSALFVALRLCVTAYLVYLSIRLWRLPPLGAVLQRTITPRDVLVTTLLNPKAAIFALVIIPMQSPVWPRYLLGFCGLAICASFTWTLAGIALGRGLFSGQGHRILFRLGASVIMIFAGVLLWPVLRIGLPV